MKKTETTRILPERLKKKLVSELILNFDREFPLIMERINEIDEKISKIVSGIVFLVENVAALPDGVREVVLRTITGGDKKLEEKLYDLRYAGTEFLWEWVDAALKLAEVKIEKMSRTFTDLNLDLEVRDEDIEEKI